MGRDSFDPALQGWILKPMDPSLPVRPDFIGLTWTLPWYRAGALSPACTTATRSDLRPLWPAATLRGAAYDQFRCRDLGCDLRTSI